MKTEKVKREGGNRLKRAKMYVFDLIRKENAGANSLVIKDEIKINIDNDIEMTVHFNDNEGSWKQTYKVPGNFRLPLLEGEEPEVSEEEALLDELFKA